MRKKEEFIYLRMTINSFDEGRSIFYYKADVIFFSILINHRTVATELLVIAAIWPAAGSQRKEKVTAGGWGSYSAFNLFCFKIKVTPQILIGLY